MYINSGSTDESPLIAEHLVIRTIRLFPEAATTAARAHNTGCRTTAALFLLCLDGDSHSDRDYAIQALDKSRAPYVAVIWGRLRGVFPSASLYALPTGVQWISLRNLLGGPRSAALVSA